MRHYRKLAEKKRRCTRKPVSRPACLPHCDERLGELPCRSRPVGRPAPPFHSRAPWLPRSPCRPDRSSRVVRAGAGHAGARAGAPCSAAPRPGSPPPVRTDAAGSHRRLSRPRARERYRPLRPASCRTRAGPPGRGRRRRPPSGPRRSPCPRRRVPGPAKGSVFPIAIPGVIRKVARGPGRGRGEPLGRGVPGVPGVRKGGGSSRVRTRAAPWCSGVLRASHGV